MNLLKDADTARYAVGRTHASHSHLDVDRLVVSAIQHGDVGVAIAVAVHLVDELEYLVRLGVSVVDLVEPRLFAVALAECAEGLVELSAGILHHDVRDIKHSGQAAVVALKLYDAAAGPALWEL